jgi:hypothetical protein
LSITDNICFTNFKLHDKLKFVFDIIHYIEKCYQEYSTNLKDNNFKKDIILKVKRQFVPQNF